MRPHRLTLLLALTLALLGCATERPTRPESPILPATPVSSALTDGLSESIEAIPENGGLFKACLGELEAFRNRNFDDIELTFEKRVLAPDSVKVYDCRTREWQLIQSALWRAPICWSFVDYCYTFTTRMTSQIHGTVASDFLDSAGTFYVKADDVYAVGIRLIKWSKYYSFRVVRDEGWSFGTAGLTFSKSQLYEYSVHNQRDSIHALDLEGRRIWNRAVDSDQGAVFGSTFDGEYFWVSGDVSMSRIDTLGQIIGSIEVPRSILAATWAKGTLWYAVPDFVCELDLDSSLSTGRAVVASRFMFEERITTAMSSDSLGLVITSRPFSAGGPFTAVFHRYTFDGQSRDKFVSHIGQVDAITWDGNWLWALHHGPREAQTDATLLTRFTLE